MLPRSIVIIHRPGQRLSPADPTIPACSWQAYQKGSYIAPAPSIRTRGRALGASHTANGIIKRAKDFRETRTNLRRRRSLSQSLRTHPERAQILGGVPRPVAKINPGKAKYPDLDPAKGWAGSREGTHIVAKPMRWQGSSLRPLSSTCQSLNAPLHAPNHHRCHYCEIPSPTRDTHAAAELGRETRAVRQPS